MTWGTRRAEVRIPKRPIASLALAMIVFCSPLHAQTVGRYFGSEVNINGEWGFGQSLVIEGKQVLEGFIISLDEVAMLNGVGVIIGSTGDSGNACNLKNFVISFPQGSSPRLDGPLDECRPVSHSIMNDRIEFRTKPMPLDPGNLWAWTAERGFVAGPEIPFVSDSTKGWDDLRARAVNHPGDLFNYGEVAQSIKDVALAEEKIIVPILTGVGSGKFNGDMYIGSACKPRMCGEQEAIVVADIRNKKIFLAWKVDKKPIVARPALNLWPQSARSAYANWKRPDWR